MNFEDQASKGLGKYSQGTSKRRFIVALVSVFIVLTGVFLLDHFNKEEAQDPVDLVNPLMGTDSEFRLSNGNTYPAIALPWGMNFWTPQTNLMGDGWCYQYAATKIRGFKQKQMNR